MIRKLTVTKPSATLIKWWDKIDAFKTKKGTPYEIEFQPGLNILWGPNGSGKSSIISMLGKLTHSEQGGVSTVTDESVRAFSDFKKALDGQDLDTDGQVVRYCDPAHAAGLVGGMSGFDDDFFDLGLANVMFKGSGGQTTMNRMYDALKAMKDGKMPDLRVKAHVPKAPVKNPKEDAWRYDLDLAHYENYQRAIKGVTPNGEPGQLTFLFDEPDRSLDLPIQLRFWDTMLAHSKWHQIIVASHSMFALDLPKAHYIELVPGYIEECRKAKLIMIAYSTETAAPKTEEASKKKAPRKRKTE